MGTRKAKKNKPKNMWTRSLAAALAAMAISVLLAVLFAFALQKQLIGMEGVDYINMGIKLVSSVIAALIAASAASSRAPLWGAFAALTYMTVTFLLFSLFSGSFSPQWKLAADAAMCAAAGAVTGMLVNLKKKR